MIITESKYIVEAMTFITEFIKKNRDSIKEIVTLGYEDEEGLKSNRVAYQMIVFRFRMEYELRYGYYPSRDVIAELHEQLKQELDLIELMNLEE